MKKKPINSTWLPSSVCWLSLLMVGVFGLTIFETAYRRKEIGIRKVYGAKTSDILWNFNRTYLRIITICSIIASPFALVLHGQMATKLYYPNQPVTVGFSDSFCHYNNTYTYDCNYTELPCCNKQPDRELKNRII